MVKILFLGANPLDTTRLALPREAREIQERLGRGGHESDFKLEQTWAPRRRDLQAAFLETEPDMVHFSGHGEQNRSAQGAAVNARGSLSRFGTKDVLLGRIMVEDGQGNAVPIPIDALGELFRLQEGRVRCVVLNACHSKDQAEAIVQHVDCVIGMSWTIEDAAAITFAGAFYEALGAERSVAEAFEMARHAMETNGSHDVDVPVLLVRKGVDAGAVFLFPKPRAGVAKRD